MEMLCETYEAPKEQKIDILLALTDMGDERPSEFALELLRLASDATADDFLKRIFVRCLPACTVMAITGSLAGNLREIAKAEDRAWTAAATTSASTVKVSAVSAPTSGRGSRRGGHQRGGCQSGGQSTRQTTALNLCSFHKKFGDSARRCIPACSRWGEERPREAQEGRVFQVEDALNGEDTDIGSPALGNA